MSGGQQSKEVGEGAETTEQVPGNSARHWARLQGQCSGRPPGQGTLTNDMASALPVPSLLGDSAWCGVVQRVWLWSQTRAYDLGQVTLPLRASVSPSAKRTCREEAGVLLYKAPFWGLSPWKGVIWVANVIVIGAWEKPGPVQPLGPSVDTQQVICPSRCRVKAA